MLSTKGCSTSDSVIVRQVVTALFGFLASPKVMPKRRGDILCQLIATKGLLPTIQLLPITKHREAHHVGTDIHQRDYLPLAAFGKLLEIRSRGGKRRIGLDIHDHSLEAGRLDNRNHGLRPFPSRMPQSEPQSRPVTREPGQQSGSQDSLPQARKVCTDFASDSTCSSSFLFAQPLLA